MFRDNQETKEWLIQQIITRMRHPELQKQLLAKGIELMLQEDLNSGRTHKASINHMKQLTEIQERDSQKISVIKQSHCKQCGSTHSNPKGKCPSWSTTCLTCGKKNHRVKMCINKNKNKGRHIRARTAQNSNSSQSCEYQTKKRGNRICSMKFDKREPSKLYKKFEQLAFDAIQQQKVD